jgi:hypothetical protein
MNVLPPVYAHELGPGEHGAAQGPAAHLDPHLLLAAVFAMTVMSTLLGTLTGFAASRHQRTAVLSVGFAGGALMGLLFDLLKSTSGLGTGTLNSLLDLLNLLGLLVGATAAALLCRRPDLPTGLTSAYSWALIAVGAHSVGEGIVIGYDVATGETVISLFQASSFALHKVAEGFAIGVVFSNAGALRLGLLTSVLVSLAVPLGAVSALTGLPPGFSTIWFATASGAIIWSIPTVFSLKGSADLRNRLGGLLIGFVFVYLAGTLHQLI